MHSLLESSAAVSFCGVCLPASPASLPQSTRDGPDEHGGMNRSPCTLRPAIVSNGSDRGA